MLFEFGPTSSIVMRVERPSFTPVVGFIGPGAPLWNAVLDSVIDISPNDLH